MFNYVLTGFSDEIDDNFQTQLQEMSNLNIAYIEIRGVNGRNITSHTLEEVKELKRQLDEAGIKVSAIGSPLGKISIEDEFEPHFELFKHTVEIAAILETNYIRLFSFYVASEKTPLFRNEVMSRLTAFTDYIRGTKMILLHENEKDIYGDSVERCLDLYKELGCENFKLIFDPANFIQCGQETYPYAFHSLKDYVAYYHIKDALVKNGNVVPSGFGDGHLGEILHELSKRNYQGFLSIEPHLGDFDGFSELEVRQSEKQIKEKSSAAKFKLATDCLLKLIRDIED